ncbi:MAG: HAD-IA family hydrolase [Lachnospiraceae bacterium]|nr:HAD-IA family hydrolase [Lachnospiraceae bacterium]
MIKAVIFDMFETLASLFEGRTYFSEHMAEDVGLPHTEFRKAWHTTEQGRSCGKYTIEEGVETALRLMGNYKKESVTLLAGKRRESLEDTFRVIPEDSLDLLKGLKERGLLTGLISNCYSDEREFIINSPLYPYFDAVMLSYEQGVCKPDPEIFKRAADKLGVEPGECLYVGDGGSDELFAASKMGMKAVQTLVFHDMAYEPHVPCGVLSEFPHIYKQDELYKYL